MKNAWPVKAQGVGGRHYRGTCVDQNFDSYAVEYTFADGAKLFMDGRNVAGAQDIYASYVHGSKGLAIASKSGDCGPPSSTYKGQNPDRGNMTWESQVPPEQGNPYDNEWNDLVDAIRNDKPYNEVERHHGQCGDFAGPQGSSYGQGNQPGGDAQLRPRIRADADKWTMDSPPPLKSDADGKYPIPQPGIVTTQSIEATSVLVRAGNGRGAVKFPKSEIRSMKYKNKSKIQRTKIQNLRRWTGWF